ncbi:MAG: MATE family efflux transporter [Chitinophagaceae bacterium]|nr:MATE family efflux transporter [Chitinophagaceae bacterium]
MQNLQVKNSYRNIMQLALPVAIAMVIPQLNILTNTLFLGNYVPENSLFSTQDFLAASGIAGIYYLTLSMVGYGLSAGVLMLMSRSAGSNDAGQVGKIFSNGVILSLLLSAALMLSSWYVAPYIFEHSISNESVKTAAIAFIKIRLGGLPFIVLCHMANAFFLASSSSRFIIAGSFAQTGTNILFDYLLINGACSFPEMGLNGTAVASLISEIIYMIVSFTILMQSSRFKNYCVHFFSGIDWKLIQHTFIKSLPLTVQFLLSIGAWEVFFILVEHLGKVDSASSQLLRTVFGIVGIAAWALGSTTNSMVSNLIGQQKADDVKPLIRKIVTISFSFAFVLGLLLLFFPDAFLQLLTHDQQIIHTAAMPLRIVVLATWTLSVSTVYFNAVLGTGHTKANMYFELISITLYLAYSVLVIEYLHLPLAYAWASEFVYWFSLLGMSAFFIHSGRWRKNIGVQTKS